MAVLLAVGAADKSSHIHVRPSAMLATHGTVRQITGSPQFERTKSYIGPGPVYSTAHRLAINSAGGVIEYV
jgi:hypothetical protein